MTRSGTRNPRDRNGRSGSSTVTSRWCSSGAPAVSRRARGGCGRPGGADLQRQADRGPAPGDVVVEVAVEPLEARVEVRDERGEQDLDVEVGQPARALQLAEPGRGPGGRTGLLDLAHRLVVARRAGGAGREQPVDVVVGQVEPAERVVRRRVVAPAVLDHRPHPGLDQRDPGEQVPEPDAGGVDR